MAINLGSTSITNLKLGTAQVEKVFLGTTEVWSHTQPTNEWGRLGYYSVYSIQYTEEFADMCTINSIDTSVLSSWLAQQEDFGGVEFRYEEVWDPETGQSTGEYAWQYGLGGDVVIAPEDMLSTTGIDVTLDVGTTWATFSLQKTIVVDETSPVIEVTLTQSEYDGLNSDNYSIGSLSIPKEAIVSFEFGSLATTTPVNFLNSSSIQSVDFSNAQSLVSIGNGFLLNCQGFNQPISLPNTVTTIGNQFLWHCSSYNGAISIPNSVTSIGNQFLYSCQEFNQSLILPNSITSIGIDFLNYCNSMISIIDVGSLPATVISSSESTFATPTYTAPCYTTGMSIAGQYADDWVTKFPNRTNTPFRNLKKGYVVPVGSLVTNNGVVIQLTDSDVPNLCTTSASTITVGGQTVATNDIYGVDISESNVYQLGHSFLANTSVKVLRLPSSLTLIGSYFLMNCTSYNYPLNIPSSVYSIGASFLQGGHHFNQPITIPSGVTSIPGGFLEDCPGFNSALVIPDTVTSIGYGFLSKCSNFNQPLTLPNSITQIDSNFLYNCIRFNRPLTLPNSVVSIGMSFLYNCKAMTSTVNVGSLPASVAIQTNDSFADVTTSTRYNAGMPLVGTYANDWKTRFPNSSTAPYRNII